MTSSNASVAIKQPGRARLFAVLAGLYIAQSIPGYLFVAALPLYTTAIGFGAVAIAGHVARTRQSRLCTPVSGAPPLERPLALALGFALALHLYGLLVPWLEHWQHAVTHRFRSEREVARYLDALPASARVFSDNPMIEALVRFRPGRVERGQLSDAGFRQRVELAAHRHDVYVAGRRDHVLGAQWRGELVLELERSPSAGPAWDGGSALAVLHLEAPRSAESAR